MFWSVCDKFAMSFPFWILFNGLREIQKGGVEKVKIEVALDM